MGRTAGGLDHPGRSAVAIPVPVVVLPMDENGVGFDDATAPVYRRRFCPLAPRCPPPSRGATSRASVRARPGRLSVLSVFHSKSGLYGAFVSACRALNSQNRRFPARAEYRAYDDFTATQFAQVRGTPCWPSSWANFSLLQLHSHHNARVNSQRLGQPNTALATVVAARAYQLLGQLVITKRPLNFYLSGLSWGVQVALAFSIVNRLSVVLL